MKKKDAWAWLFFTLLAIGFIIWGIAKHSDSQALTPAEASVLFFTIPCMLYWSLQDFFKKEK